jgi:hypothetical protein
MTTQETLVKYLSDMYALEEHIAQPLKSQAKDEDFEPYPEASALVAKMLARTESAMTELETVSKGLGGDARSGIKSAVTAMAGVAAAVINEARTHPITKKLRDDHVALCLASMGYELLHVTANALNSPEIGQMALTRLHELAGIIMESSQVIIPVAVKELSGTNEVDMTTVATSQANVKAAWSE